MLKHVLLAIALIALIAPTNALADGGAAPSIVVGEPVIGATNGNCFYNNAGVVGHTPCGSGSGPVGSTYDIEYNAGGLFGGSGGNFTYTPSTKILYLFGSLQMGFGAGVNNIGIGLHALPQSSSGANNIGIGNYALNVLTSGGSNIAIGGSALESVTTGGNNIGIGYVLYGATTGGFNIGIGSSVLTGVLTNSSAQNIGIGISSLQALTTGSSNISIGVSNLNAITTTVNNVAVGNNIMTNSTSTGINTAFGGDNMTNLADPAQHNTALGYSANAAMTTGSYNTGVGDGGLEGVTTGNSNTQVAFGASNITTGSNNSCFGAGSCNGLSTGNNNTIIGGNSSSTSTFVENYSLPSALTGAIVINTGDGVIHVDYNKSMSGGWTLGGGIAHPKPTTKTASTYAVVDADYSLIFNSASSQTVTLPAAASYPGRILKMKTINTGGVVSDASNVVPLAGGSAGTALLATTAGKFAELQSDGTNWQIINGN